jgi:hypothetical protein
MVACSNQFISDVLASCRSNQLDALELLLLVSLWAGYRRKMSVLDALEDLESCSCELSREGQGSHSYFCGDS